MRHRPLALLLLLTVGLGSLFAATPWTIAVGAPAKDPGDANSHSPDISLELVGQLGGYSNAVAVSDQFVYLGLGPRLLILNILDPANPRLVGETPVLPAIVQDVVVAGDRAYVAFSGLETTPLEPAGLQIVDVSVPTDPRLLGTYARTGLTSELEVVDTVVYLTSERGLEILDVRDPSAPRLIGIFEAPDTSPGSVSVTGNLAYFVARTGYGYEGTLRVVDVSNPAAPRQLGSYGPSHGRVGRVRAAGDRVYITYRGPYTETHELQILDATTPADLRLRGTYQTATPLEALEVVGTTVYLAGDALEIVDAGDPEAPRRLGSYDAPFSTADVAVAGGRAYLAEADDGGLRVVDVGDPSNPRRLALYDAPGNAHDLDVEGDLAAIVGGRGRAGLHLVDVSNASDPRFAGFYSRGNAFDVAIQDGLVYLAAGGGHGLEIVDARDPYAPREIGTLDTSGDAVAVDVEGEYAYIGEGSHGNIVVIDVSQPMSPTQISHVRSGGGTVHVVDQFVYTSVDRGLGIVDVGDPAQPQLLGFLEGAAPNGVSVANGLAYLITTRGLKIVDVSDPTAPVLRGHYDDPVEHDSVFGADISVAGDLAFVAARSGGVQVYDVSDPAAPRLLTYYNTAGSADGIRAAGGLVYVADGAGGLLVLRAAPTTPGPSVTPSPTVAPPPSISIEYVGGIDGNARSVAVSDTLVFAGAGAALTILDVRDGPDPVRLARQPLPDLVEDVEIEGSVLYAAVGRVGLALIDVSDPRAPVPLGRFDTPGHANDVAVDGTLAYVADRQGDLQIIDVADPAQPRLRGAFRIDGLVGSVDVAGGRAYLTIHSELSDPQWWDKLQVVDVSDPAHPTEAVSEAMFGGAAGLQVVDGLLYVAGDGLRIYDTNGSRGLEQVAHYGAGRWGSGDVHVAGDLAFLSTCRGLELVDVSNPAAPAQRGVYSAPRCEVDAAPAGAFVAVAVSGSGVHIVDAADPASPTLRGRYATLGDVRALQVADGIAYLADRYNGLVAIDVARAGEPVLLGTGDTGQGSTWGVTDVDVEETRAYLTDDEFGLFVFDVGNPLTPTLQSRLDLEVADVQAVGDMVYMTGGWNRLYTVDASDPSSPTIRAQFEYQRHDFPAALSLEVAGQHAYLAGHNRRTGYGGLWIVDVGDPDQPALVGTLETPGSLEDVDVVENVAYASDIHSFSVSHGLEVIEVGQPAAPALQSRIALETRIDTIEVVDPQTIVTGGPDGVQVLALAGSDHAVVRGSFDLSSGITELKVVGDLVYVANGEGGFHILRLRPNAPAATPTPSATGSATPAVTPSATTTAVPGGSPTPTTTAATGLTASFVAEADARVDEGRGSVNFGSQDFLRADAGEGTDEESYLRFSVRGASGVISRAVLRLYSLTNTDGEISIYRAGDGWTETTINWINRPPRAGIPADRQGNVRAQSFVDFDVTALVGGNGTYSFALVAESSDGLTVSSREGVVAPRLFVTYSGPATLYLPLTPRGE